MRIRKRVITIIIIGVFLINYTTGYPFTYPIIEYRAKTLELNPISTNLSEEDVLDIYKVLICPTGIYPKFLDPVAHTLNYNQFFSDQIDRDLIGLPSDLLDLVGLDCDIKWGRYEDVENNDFFSMLMPTYRGYNQLSVPKVLDNDRLYVDQLYLSSGGGGAVQRHYFIKNSVGKWVSDGLDTMIYIDYE